MSDQRNPRDVKILDALELSYVAEQQPQDNVQALLDKELDSSQRCLLLIQTDYAQVIKRVGANDSALVFQTHQYIASSPLIKLLAEQNVLSFVICGYLFHKKQILAIPSLSHPGVFQLNLPDSGNTVLEEYCQALTEVLAIIQQGKSRSLVMFLLANIPAEEDELIEVPRKEPDTMTTSVDKIGFLGNFLHAQDILYWDRALSPLSAQQCDALLQKTHGILEPFVACEFDIHAPNGGVIGAQMIALPMTSEQMMNAYRSGGTDAMNKLLDNAVQLARKNQVSYLGFGAFTSIVTRNCTTVKEQSIGLTSGNSLTAAAAAQALENVALEKGIEIEAAHLAVVGASGNIGQIITELLCTKVATITLIGRKNSYTALLNFAHELFYSLFTALKSKKPITGHIGRMINDIHEQVEENVNTGANYYEAVVQVLGDDIPIKVADDFTTLNQANIIVSVSNSPVPLITPPTVSDKHEVVICDIAVPGDTTEDLQAKRNNVTIIKGGRIKLPLGQTPNICGFTLPEGEVYACFAETVLLGFCKEKQHYSYGKLTIDKVKKIKEIAEQYDFRVVVES